MNKLWVPLIQLLRGDTGRLLNHFLLFSKHSTTIASAFDHTKQEDKQNDVTVAAYKATPPPPPPPMNKNHKPRERCDKEGSTCHSVGGDD
jgi:hypothetical protein